MGSLHISLVGLVCLIFSLLSLVAVVVSTSFEFTNFKGEPGQKIKDELIYHEEKAFSIARCAASCQLKKGCLSLSFKESDRLCQLSEKRLNGSSDPEKLLHAGLEWSTVSIRCFDNWIQLGDGCYFFDKITRRNYYAAKKFCTELGGKMAEPQTREDFELLRGYLLKTTVSSHWLGLNDIKEENNFVWTSNGEAPLYSVWENRAGPDGGKRENCVHLKSHSLFRWQDIGCNHVQRTVCQK